MHNPFNPLAHYDDICAAILDLAKIIAGTAAVTTLVVVVAAFAGAM